MKAFFSVLITIIAATASINATTSLTFDPASGTAGQLTLPTGKTVRYTAYERIYYVTNVEDSAYQYLNVYVPAGATQATPIFLRTYVGGYMASSATAPQAGDASGRALAEGFVVVIPGTRGRNSTIIVDKAYAKTHKSVKRGATVYTGRAPWAIIDLKAAIRYLRQVDDVMPGNAERIVTDGTSAGGAMSALLGATGNNPAYEPLLNAMGAAKQRDDVFAAVCYCPIIDLEHADMAYEWTYGGTDSRRAMDDIHRGYTAELAALFPNYINSLGLHLPDGTPLTADNYGYFVKSEIIRGAQLAKNAGATIPDSLGFTFSEESHGAFAPPVNGQRGDNPMKPPMRQGGAMTPRGAFNGSQKGEYITDLDMDIYLNYVVSTQALKTVPAFDSMITDVNNSSGENEEFGDDTGSKVNFTAFTAAKNGTTVTADVQVNTRLMNPMSFLGDGNTTVAPHWYIRHGARDRDTAFPVPINFALKLQNIGKDVNFLLAWNRPHSGDYALDELFDWLRDILND